jgi:hypothetical protein
MNNMPGKLTNWTTLLKRGVIGGTAASALSTVALAALGKRETGSPYAATNAVSHVFYGDRAVLQDKPSWRYTATGYLVHHVSATFWALLAESVLGRFLDRKKPLTTLEVAAVSTAVACFVDYKLTPERFQPGFEMRLSKPSLAVVFGAFGVGLGLAAWMVRRKD